MSISVNEILNVETLKELQKQMLWEDANDHDYQASPRFWAIKDFRTVPGNEEYTEGFDSYFYNDGDLVEFNDINSLKEFLEEMYDSVSFYEYSKLIELQQLVDSPEIEFNVLWNFVYDNLNDEGYFGTCWMTEEDFIREDTMFLTKKEAQNHLRLNKHHYSSKAHTFAMPAWRAPQVNEVLKLLMNIDLDKLHLITKE